MRYRRLGRSDLEISEISLGSWLTFGVDVDAERGAACVRRALDLGVNFIDTANVYGRGAAESFLGEVLQGVDRSSYVLATKVYFPMSDTDRGLSAGQIRKQSDASLKRLRTDYVDLYQCHRYDPDTPLEETMEALSDVVRQGKARYIGFSEWQPDQIRAALAIPGVERFVSSQPEYSMLWRKPEAEVFPLCAAEGIGQVVWSPLAQGVLTGKYKPGSPPPAGSRAASENSGQWMGRWRDDDVLEAVERLRPVAERAGMPMARLALAWVLRRPEVTSAIVGASRPEQVDENVAASGVTFDDDLLAAIDEALGNAVGP
ncbi:MAG: aldo/keto reductase family protein [Actinomycetota bacterium]|nr:aldo/keto reductase family protein [Actinomycetota bacterium]